MGKLKHVLSQRILWFSRRRFLTAQLQAARKGRRLQHRVALVGSVLVVARRRRLETAAILATAVVVTLACQDDAMAPDLTPSADEPASPLTTVAMDPIEIDVTVAAGDTSDFIVPDPDQPPPYGPPLKQFSYRGQTGDVAIADVIGVTENGVHGSRVIGVSEGTTTWKMFWDDYGRDAPYQFFVNYNVTVAGGTTILNEAMLLSVGSSQTKDVGSEPTLTVTSGEGVVTAVATSSGATFTGVTVGEAEINMAWTDAADEAQQVNVLITVLAEPVSMDTVQVDIGAEHIVETDAVGGIHTDLLEGAEFSASVEHTRHAGRSHAIKITGVAVGATVWQARWDNQDREPVVAYLYIEVLSDPVMEEMTLQIGAEEMVELGAQPTVTHIKGGTNVVKVSSMDTGAQLLGQHEGTAEYMLSWDDTSQKPMMQRRQLNITVPAPPDPSVDSVTIEVGGSHTVDVVGEATVTLQSGTEGTAASTITDGEVTLTAANAGEATYRLVWDDSRGVYQALDVHMTVPVPPTPEVEEVTIEIGDSHTQEVGYAPTLISKIEGDDVTTHEATATGVTFTAITAGEATYRVSWAGEGGVIGRLDVAVTVPLPPPPLEDSPILAVGDTITWAARIPNPGDGGIRKISGDDVATVTRTALRAVGVQIIGHTPGTGVYRLTSFDWQCICDRTRDLHITVLTALPDGQSAVDLVDREFSVREGDTVYVRAILRAPATTDVTIPVSVTMKDLPSDIQSLAYDWEANDAATDHTVVDGASSISIASGEQYGVIGIAIKDDDLIEPASSEVLRIEATPPPGMRLVSRGSWLELRIAEGVCDRTSARIRGHYVIRGLKDSPRWIGTECHELTDQTLAEIRTFLPTLRDGEKLQFKMGDFAGLTGTTTFGLSGMPHVNTPWDKMLFQDLDSVVRFWFENWSLPVLKTEMFVGINAEVEEVRLQAAEEWDPEVRQFALERRLLNPFRQAKTVELIDWPIANIDRRLLYVIPGVENLTLDNFGHLNALDSRAFRQLKNLKHLKIRNMPYLVDEGMPTGVFGNQKSTLTSLELTNLGLTALPVHSLFGNENVTTDLVTLDLTGNGYTSTSPMLNASSFPDLRRLHLEENQIETLAADAFAGLRLWLLHLDENPGAPFQISSELEKSETTEGEVRAKLAVALPTDLDLRVYGQNIEGNEFTIEVPAGSDTSSWVAVAQSDTTKQVLLRAVLDQGLPDDYTGISVGLKNRGAGEAILYRMNGQGGNRLPVVLKNMKDIDLSMGSTTRPQSASITLNLDDYVAGKVESRALSYSAVATNDHSLGGIGSTVIEVSLDATARTVTIAALQGGEAGVRITASDGPQSIRFEFSVSVTQIDGNAFNIQVVKLGSAATDSRLSTAIDAAQAHWESVLRDAPDIFLGSGGSSLSCRSSSAGGGGHTLDRSQTLIDDIVMVIAAVDVDGQYGTLAQAGLCVSRNRDSIWGNAAGLPAMGRLVMDNADIDYLAGLPGGLEGTVTHEMGQHLPPRADLL